jgi:hypothetical protein
VSEPEDVRRSADRENAGANAFYLLLSQPEIVSWLELSEQELVSWLAPGEGEEEGNEEPRAA